MNLPLIFRWIAGVGLAICSFASPLSALGDTYTVREVGFSIDLIAGIDTAGTAVLFGPGFVPDFDLYYVYPIAGAPYFSSTRPDLDYDDGVSGCTPVTHSGVTWDPSAGTTICNGTHEEYMGFYTPAGSSTQVLGIFMGPDVSDLLTGPGFKSSDIIYADALNSNGDLLWWDSNADANFEAIDLTKPVPEPGSLLLVGTGVAAVVGRLRRRLR